MAETLDAVMTDEMDPQRLAEQLLAQAKEQGVHLVWPGGLLNRLTKDVLETALEAEMGEHLGYDKHDSAGRTGGNSRNGTRAKTVLTEIGPVEIEVPRDTDSSFDPQIVRKRQRRLTGAVERCACPRERTDRERHADLRHQVGAAPDGGSCRRSRRRQGTQKHEQHHAQSIARTAWEKPRRWSSAALRAASGLLSQIACTTAFWSQDSGRRDRARVRA